MPSYRTVYDSDGCIPSVDVLDDIQCRQLKENFDSLEKDAGTFGGFFKQCLFLIILKWNVKLIWFILLKNHIKRYVYTTKLRKLIVKLQRQLVSKIYNYKTKPKVQQKCVKINYSHFNVNLTKRVCIMLIKTLYLILDCSLLFHFWPYFHSFLRKTSVSIFFSQHSPCAPMGSTNCLSSKHSEACEGYLRIKCNAARFSIHL